MADYFEDQEFGMADWQKQLMPAADYEGCRFSDIQFGEADLTGFRFVDCHFIRCQFGNIHQPDTVWSNVIFEGCKLTGTHFTEASQAILSVEFRQCKLDMSSFYQCKLRHTKFSNSSLREVDFTEVDLRDSVFLHCDLADAKFEYCNLQNADLRTALHYQIRPDRNNLTKARFSWPAASGLLTAYGIRIEE